MKLLSTTICSAVLAFGAKAENWGQWRGPNFNGSSPETGLPDKLSKTENVAWSVQLPGPGAASPIIWEDRVFVSSVDAKTTELVSQCFSRKDGKLMWEKRVGLGSLRTSGTGKNTSAASSPVTDGQRVFFTFGSGDLTAYDMDGKLLWARNLAKEHGPLTFMHGYGSTPLLYKDKLYVVVMRNQRNADKNAAQPEKPYESYLLAIDPATGKDLWKQIRPTDGTGGEEEGYASPIPHQTKNGDEILIAGALYITAHKAETGEELWRWGKLNPVKVGNVRIVASAVSCDDMVYAAGAQKLPIFAFKPTHTGTLPESDIVWKFNEAPPNVPTTLVYNGLLYMLDGTKKVITCADPKTGEKKWQGNLPITSTLSGSPAGADGKIYIISEAGDVLVLDAGNEFKILNNVALEEPQSFASIAIAHKQVFVRAGAKLYCFAKK